MALDCSACEHLQQALQHASFEECVAETELVYVVFQDHHGPSDSLSRRWMAAKTERMVAERQLLEHRYSTHPIEIYGVM